MFNPSIAVYRRLVKSLRLKFSGDRKTYTSLRSAFKADIQSHKSETDATKISSLIFDLDQAREWLTTEVMRADLMEDGKYKLKIIKEQLQSINLKPVSHPEYFEFSIPCSLLGHSDCGHSH